MADLLVNASVVQKLVFSYLRIISIAFVLLFFQYIENLENLKKLLQLTLNNHMIEKIEKLDHLTQLRELHLANNCIPKIEGLDCLVHLTVLNLNGNLIETLPAPVFKKLKELQAFHVAHNRIGSVSIHSNYFSLN